jgi:hypothetical protein
MNRVEFTHQIVNLLAAMMLDKEYPIIDYVKRSKEEQKRLFDLGLSKADGVNGISGHQIGKAVDIYFPDLDDVDKDMDKNELLPPKMGWEYWHKYWEEKGGKPMIDWDKGHFEG